MTWAWSLRLPVGPKMVLLYLADSAGPDGAGGFTGHKTMAQACSMSRATIQRHLNDLRTRGLVEIEARYRENGGRTSNGYQVGVPWAVPPPQNEAAPASPGEAGNRPVPLPKTSLELATPALTPTQDLVGYYIDASRERGAEPPGRVRGQVAREIGGLVKDGIGVEQIRAGIDMLLDRRLHPATLASLVHEASLPARQPQQGGAARTMELARRLAEEGR